MIFAMGREPLPTTELVRISREEKRAREKVRKAEAKLDVAERRQLQKEARERRLEATKEARKQREAKRAQELYAQRHALIERGGTGGNPALRTNPELGLPAGNRQRITKDPTKRGGFLPRVLTSQKTKFFELMAEGHTVAYAAQEAGFSTSTGTRLNKEFQQTKQGIELNEERAFARTSGPKPHSQLCHEAKISLEDFTYFQRRYFGVVGHPWQKEAAELLAAAVATPDREYFVINVFPGSGKSTLFSCHIPAWLTCRNRAFRGMIGSATTRLAEAHLRRLRKAFERTIPEQADADQLVLGAQFDADATLSEEFGRFKPQVRELWTARDIVVEQLQARGPLSEKEPTWSSFSIESGFLGMRYPFIVWDDLVTPENQRTSDKREEMQETWRKVCETRLEPGGVMILLGQRLYGDDLYRYVLDMQVPVEESDEEDEDEPQAMKPKYTHIVYKAHYEEKCQPEFHERDAPAYPVGCLLVPNRFPWRDVRNKMQDTDWLTVYQQEDVDPREVLVDPDWIYGYEPDGIPGCRDMDRKVWEIPRMLGDGEVTVVASCDPSPTRWWACELWMYQPRNELRYLIALERRKMDAPDFLDWNESNGCFTGLMDAWQTLSEQLGYPISHWVIEANAAQRWLLQFDHFRRWQDRRQVEVIPHTTGRNKADPELGVQTIAPHYRFGRVRLPWADEEARLTSLKLVHEVTRYPHGRSDDCVMAQWFFEWNLPDIHRPVPFASQRAWRPSWMRRSA